MLSELRMTRNFQLLTLVDITSTGVKHSLYDPVGYHKDCNFQTVLHTLTRRCNIEFDEEPNEIDVSAYRANFGSRFKGQHKAWIFDFRVSHPGSITTQVLKDDFAGVSFISGLSETVKFEQAQFQIDDSNRNIVFFEGQNQRDFLNVQQPPRTNVVRKTKS